MNSRADHNVDTIDDLEYLNFSSIANLLRKFNEKYFPTGVHISPDARDENFDSFPEDQLEKGIDEIEDILRSNSEDHNIALRHHIQETGVVCRI